MARLWGMAWQWLTEEERKDLKRQEAEEKRAEEERRKRVTVTFDLVGRKVLMADAEQEAAQAKVLTFAHTALRASRLSDSDGSHGRLSQSRRLDFVLSNVQGCRWTQEAT